MTDKRFDVADDDVQDVHEPEEVQLAGHVPLEGPQKGLSPWFGRWVFIIAVLVLAVSAAWGYRTYRTPFSPPDVGAVEQNTREIMVALADRIDSFRSQEGSLPRFLAQLPEADQFPSDIRYTVQGNQYALSTRTLDGQNLTYEDGDSKQAFQEGN